MMQIPAEEAQPLPAVEGKAFLRSASLNGFACQAIAWIHATSIDVLDGEGGTRRVPGVRSWRGRALVDRAALPPEFFSYKAVRYNGKVLDGDQERDILADVFLLITGSSRSGREASPDARRIYVDFIGAETPSKSLR